MSTSTNVSATVSTPYIVRFTGKQRVEHLVTMVVFTLLCLTGLGAFLGVPLIILAIIAPLAGPLIGIGEHEVRCPFCNTREITFADGKLHSCPNCKQEFSLGEHHQVAHQLDVILVGCGDA